MSVEATVKEEARRLGFDQVGICRAKPAAGFEHYSKWLRKGYGGSMDYLVRHAELKKSPENLLPGAKSVVAVGLNYNQPNPYHEGHPRIARYALGRDYHNVLRSKLRKLQNWLSTSVPGSLSRVCVDSAPIFEREYAHEAGLGWFGKNTMLIDSRRGSWFVIGLLLTTAELAPDGPSIGGCGTCQACVDACPTGCIILEDGRWQIDSRRCLSYLTIEHKGPISPDLEPSIGSWTFGCDVCQEVCPFNQPRASQPMRAEPTTESDFLSTKSWPSLQELVQIERGQWDELTKASPVRRAGLDGLKRNAGINLRNLGS